MPDIFVSDQATEENEAPAREETVVKNSPKKGPKIVSQNKEVGLFSSFCRSPLNMFFREFDANEVTILFLRRHFITNLSWIIKGILLGLIPLGVSILLTLSGTSLSFLPASYQIFILVYFYFLIFLYLFFNYLNWFFNISIITNVHVIDVDFGILVFKDVASTKHELIDDVSYLEVGPVRTIFDYGDVDVQTAGETLKFDLNAVPHPGQVVHIIEDLIGGANAH